MLGLWKTELGKVNEKAGQSLADPTQYENLFPGFQEALKTQQFLAQQPSLMPASYFTKIPLNIERNAQEEMNQNEQQGNFQYSKTDKPTNGDILTSELVESVKRVTLNDTPAAAASVTSNNNNDNNQQEPPAKARKNSLDEFDFDEEIDENIDTSEVNLDDDELLSD